MTDSSPTVPLFSVPIEDPRFYVADPWPTFARMREHAPFYYYEPLDTFVVTRHADIRAIAGLPETFVSSRGLFLNDVKYQAQAGDELITDSFFPEGGEQVGTTDPPRHAELRRVMAPAFSAEAMGRVRESLTRDVRGLVDGITPDQVVDWVSYADLVPINAAIRLIGLPHTELERVRFWSDELEKLAGDLTFEELRAAAAEFRSLQRFIVESLEGKRRGPGDGDLLTVLLTAELDDKGVSEANVVMFAMTMLAAGNDTTRSLLSGLVHHLGRHPDQWELLRRDRSLIPAAIEETLRYVTPARAMLRTATEDVEIGGRPIRAGQHVYLMYMAANRDESVFPDAHRYDVTRGESVKHLAFGAGIHHCMGARLVRTEAPIVLDALLDRFTGVKPAGEPTPVLNHIRNGWTGMPVVFTT
ncbi:cytochrome P450 [Streptomyces pseudovenezuelae]|uniref:Cytochrome P450 n=1 Tax=Streptomyces pseudovenezuelae TaxID=67350 RepID=A0ABT6LNC4_9ACTN|nr:cytochrome P450 [Streptomyces pseudovenezuelae]MDH6217815.1 cytochrome P450 [Streptomyces pseudovenezuelae]